MAIVAHNQVRHRLKRRVRKANEATATAAAGYTRIADQPLAGKALERYRRIRGEFKYEKFRANFDRLRKDVRTIVRTMPLNEAVELLDTIISMTKEEMEKHREKYPHDKQSIRFLNAEVKFVRAQLIPLVLQSKNMRLIQRPTLPKPVKRRAKKKS